MKLTNPNDAELNAAFAEKAAGWTSLVPSGFNGDNHLGVPPPGQRTGNAEIVPPFTQSADAVLPWLEKWMIENPKSTVDLSITPETKRVTLYHGKTRSAWSADSNSFPRASVIALLRAHGVEVEFTPPY